MIWLIWHTICLCLLGLCLAYTVAHRWTCRSVCFSKVSL